MNGSISDQPKKRGRPSTGGRDPFVGFRSPRELTNGIDAYAADQREPVSRSEVIRLIVAQFLRSKGYLEK